MRRMVALIAALSLLAGCGIESGRVRPEGRKAEADQAGVDPSLPENLGRPKDNRDPVDLVNRFLAAPAVDINNRVKTAASYVLPPADHWNPRNEVYVVHVIGELRRAVDNHGNTTVEVDVQHVGKLNDLGRIEPSKEGVETLKFTVVERGADGVFISNPADVLLMSDTALSYYFDALPLYFWTDDGSQLIPDLRYVKRRAQKAARAEALLQMLYRGPSPWLAPAVAGLPAGTQPPAGKKVTEGADGSLIVDLATEPGADERERLVQQLAKTLVSWNKSKLELRVGGYTQGRFDSPPDRTVDQTQQFGIFNGSVRRLGDNTEPVTLPEDLNKNLAAVAFARGQQSAILVRQDGGVSLWRKQFGATPVRLGSAKPSGQPVWLDKAGTALILAGNRLYQIAPDGAATPVPNAENITAFSLAPDKTRVALVQDGRLAMAALERASNTLALSQSQPVPTKLVKGVQNVAFTSEAELMVAGADATAVTLVWMRLDGGSQTEYTKDRFLADAKISHLVAWPFPSQVLFEVAALGSFEAQLGGRRQLTPASVSPSAEPSGNNRVSAPSFEG